MDPNSNLDRALCELDRLRAAISALAADCERRAVPYNDDSDAACRETGGELEGVAGALRAMVEEAKS